MADKYSEEDLLALSGVQHYAFCERQWGLIHLEQQWAENLRTAEGRVMHDRVHDPDYKESRVGVISARSLPLKSFSLGLVGVADLVEFLPLPLEQVGEGTPLPRRTGRYQPIPVEFKRGKPKRDDRDAVQLCGQAICLEEMLNVHIERGYLFYGQTQHRSEVVFDQELRERVAALSKKMHETFALGDTPTARKGAKCSLCSMQDICLPKLTHKVKSVKEYISEQLQATDPAL